ncbi:MAG: hypothetical protein HQK52_22255 [Oligoflexia bacterium]|nr:hypothetical protein [Oligoflexia bacterium]
MHFFLTTIIFFLITSCSNNNGNSSNSEKSMDGEETCPTGMKLDGNSKKCISICSNDLIYNKITGVCEEPMKPLSCAPPLVFNTEKNGCICPGSAVKGDPAKDQNPGSCFCSYDRVFDLKISDCRCANESYVFNDQLNKCIPNCSENQEYSAKYNECIPLCGKKNGLVYEHSIKSCREICPDHFVFDAYTFKTCVADCKGNSFLDPKSIKQCLKGYSLEVYSYGVKDSILPLLSVQSYFYILLVTQNSSPEEIELFKTKISQALMAWLRPLRGWASVDFKTIFEYDTSTDSSTFLGQNRIGVYVFPKEITGNRPHAIGHSIYLYPDSDLQTYIHEFGHLFGFTDSYEKNSNPYRCKPGYTFNTTVMCGDGKELLPADIDSIRDLYCNIYHGNECETDYHLPLDPAITVSMD